MYNFINLYSKNNFCENKPCIYALTGIMTRNLASELLYDSKILPIDGRKIISVKWVNETFGNHMNYNTYLSPGLIRHQPGLNNISYDLENIINDRNNIFDKLNIDTIFLMDENNKNKNKNYVKKQRYTLLYLSSEMIRLRLKQYWYVPYINKLLNHSKVNFNNKRTLRYILNANCYNDIGNNSKKVKDKDNDNDNNDDDDDNDDNVNKNPFISIRKKDKTKNENKKQEDDDDEYYHHHQQQQQGQSLSFCNQENIQFDLYSMTSQSSSYYYSTVECDNKQIEGEIEEEKEEEEAENNKYDHIDSIDDLALAEQNQVINTYIPLEEKWNVMNAIIKIMGKSGLNNKNLLSITRNMYKSDPFCSVAGHPQFNIVMQDLKHSIMKYYKKKLFTNLLKEKAIKEQQQHVLITHPNVDPMSNIYRFLNDGSNNNEKRKEKEENGEEKNEIINKNLLTSYNLNTNQCYKKHQGCLYALYYYGNRVKELCKYLLALSNGEKDDTIFIDYIRKIYESGTQKQQQKRIICFKKKETYVFY